VGCHNAILKNQKAEKNNHKGKQTKAKQKPNKSKQRHPKRKIGIVNKASSVEKDILCIIPLRERTKHKTEKSTTCALPKDM